jgi:hypothetical protein
MTEEGYSNGDVQCVDCRNMESYWKNGEVAFFICKTNSVALKKLEPRWRKCKNFIHTNEPALNRRKEMK